MEKQAWCEHDEKTVKYTNLNYEFGDKAILLRVRSWYCPECGVHGAESEIVEQNDIKQF